MNPEVRKVIQLIKKSSNQPIIFHQLHMHLIFLMKKLEYAYEIEDDFSKIIIYSATKNTLPNQGLETKLIKYFKNLRNSFSLKVTVICYYLLSRPLNLINHILLFELVSNFLGKNDFLDSLIIKLIRRVVVENAIYHLESNRKLSKESIDRMIEILSKKNLSIFNQIQSLPCYIVSDLSPPSVEDVEIDKTVIGHRILECIYIYIKHSRIDKFISSIIPKHPDFESGLMNFCESKFMIEKFDELIDESGMLIENREIFDQLKNALFYSKNKKKLVTDIIEFVSKQI